MRKTPEQHERNKIYMKEYCRRPEVRAKRRSYTRKWAAEWRSKPENRQHELVKRSIHNKTHKGIMQLKYRRVKNLYGLTREQYDKLVEESNNKCQICGSIEKLHIDHCHITGNVRHLLCRTCNLGIGYLKDSPSLLRQALAYLIKYDQ